VQAVTEETTPRGNDPTAAAVHQRINHLQPGFDHRRLGYRRFARFLAGCPHVTITEHPGSDLTVTHHHQPQPESPSKDDDATRCPYGTADGNGDHGTGDGVAK